MVLLHLTILRKPPFIFRLAPAFDELDPLMDLTGIVIALHLTALLAYLLPKLR
jgi:hypothetical protein